MNTDLLGPFDSARCRSIRNTLEHWYAKAGRSLPWRETNDPYRIWISEIMLQQTTVKAVIPYYERFLSRFPSVQTLAAATEAEVLQYWEGLGYYSRGRNLRLAAQQVCSVHSAKFPSDLNELQRLPGIGRYTAGAVRSFGFNLPAPIVEANTLRLYCRLLGYTEDPRSKNGQNLLWGFAEQLQPRKEAGHLNQALMELGSTICTPADPDCPNCPVKRWCRAFESGLQKQIPIKASRPEVTQVVEGTLALIKGDRWLIRQRLPEERWAGMWDFPRFPLNAIGATEKMTGRNFVEVAREAQTRFAELTGIVVDDMIEVAQIRHSVTRYRIRLVCLRAEQGESSKDPHSTSSTFRWVTLDELKSLPMPVTGRQLSEKLTAEKKLL